MASFVAASSICFPFQTSSDAVRKSSTATSSSSGTGCIENVSFGSSKHHLKLHNRKPAFFCACQQTASPLLEVSGSADNGITIPVVEDSNSILQGNNWGNPNEVSTPAAVSPLEQAHPQGAASAAALMDPVAEDLQILNNNLQNAVGANNPLLMAAAEQIFSAGGKRMRPALVFLVSKATAELAGLNKITSQHRVLAEVIEMIHTASLIHDDVLDESSVRRGQKTVHQLYGTKVAVLAGDFMFAQSSWYLATLENIEVIKLISQVIKDLASGEIKQASSLFNCDTTLEEYLEKSYYKTASLIAASTRSAAIFSGVSSEVCDKMFNYGKQLGLAFQVVDDILDFTRSTQELGKPAGSDLAKGNLTAPVLFTLEENQELRTIIESEFLDEGSLETAIKLVQEGRGMDRARALAKQIGDEAKSCLDCLPEGAVRSSLEGMVDYVLERLF